MGTRFVEEGGWYLLFLTNAICTLPLSSLSLSLSFCLCFSSLRPKRFSQKPSRHPVYKVDTGAADEVEPVTPGRSSPATTPLQSSVSLSQISGIPIEGPFPNLRRPHVDYTEGMYCEIVIPDSGGGSPPLIFDGRPPDVSMRRTSCKSSASVAFCDCKLPFSGKLLREKTL